MKNKIFFLTLLWSSSILNAQEIGIRFGEVVGGNAAIDGVFKLGKFERIHANLSFGNERLGVEALWDFILKPLEGDELKWYAGVGPSVVVGNEFLLGASGEVGLEYRFKELPIALGLDWRPTFWLIEETKFSARGFGLNLRYVIK